MMAKAYRFPADGPEVAYSPSPVGGGATGALMRALDWLLTSLGAIDGWNSSLRAVVSLVLDSPVAMVALWGPDHVQVYNDAGAVLCGPKHPRGAWADVTRLLAKALGVKRADLRGGAAGRDALVHRPAGSYRATWAQRGCLFRP